MIILVIYAGVAIAFLLVLALVAVVFFTLVMMFAQAFKREREVIAAAASEAGKSATVEAKAAALPALPPKPVTPPPGAVPPPVDDIDPPRSAMPPWPIMPHDPSISMHIETFIPMPTQRNAVENTQGVSEEEELVTTFG